MGITAWSREHHRWGQPSTKFTPIAGALLELSPSGVLGMLSTLQLLAGADYLGPALVLIGDGSDGQSGPSAHPALLPFLLRLLGEQHIAALATWPASADGGKEGACRLVLTVVELLQGPFITDPGACASPLAQTCLPGPEHTPGTLLLQTGADPPSWYLEAMLSEGAMRLLVASLDALDAAQSVGPVGLITKLVLASPQLAVECIQVSLRHPSWHALAMPAVTVF